MVPADIAGHPAAAKHARKIGLKPTETLLDRSYHHAAMRKLKDSWKRGRPDIVHFALMEALSTPLFAKGMLQVYVHTVGDKVITVADNLRIPKSYFRFEGLMVSLLRDGSIKTQEGNSLMEIRGLTVEQLVKEVAPDRVVGLSSAGVQSTAEKVVDKGMGAAHCMFVIGGFPKGHFSEDTSKLFNFTYSIECMGLESHTVIARVLYECEKAKRGA